MRRAQRLQRPEQFQRVRRDGKSWSHPLFIMNVARNRVGHTRCGFVVGKQLGKAHDRNRAKRRAREAVRRQFPQIAAGYDLVFVVRAAAQQAPFLDLQHAVAELVKRAGLWVALPPAAGNQGASDGSDDRSRADTAVSTRDLTTHSS